MNMDIKNGNVIDELKKIPDESVDCIVSSPPYYGLRDYSGVATYTDVDYDNVVSIASMDLQKHRDNALEIHKEKYYLTEPVFNKKDQKWYVSLKYDMSSVWGGNPDCEHEWDEYFREGQSGGKNSKKLKSKKVDVIENFQAFDGERQSRCNKCGAWKGQLGLEPNYHMYVEHLMIVMNELKRILKKTGTLWWNMGDSYASSGSSNRHSGYPDPKWDKARNGSFEEPTAFDQGIKPKSLMMIPERLAMAMIDDGWILRNTLCWFKKNAMPTSVSDRFSNKWEYVFFFTKSKKYYFDLDSIRKPLAGSSIKRISQKNIPNQFKSGKSVDFAETNPVNNIPKILNNMHQKYQKEGAYQGSHSGYLNEDGSLRVNLNGANPGDVINTPTVRHKSWASNPGHKFSHERKYDPDADGGDFLDIPTKPHSFAHFAVMPETLIEPLIKAGCPLDGVVLDPFAGSGTVGVVGKKQGKNAILIEISPEYVEIIKNRLEIEASGINMNVKFVETASISSMEEEE